MADNEETTQGETPEQQPPASETPPADAQQETPQGDEFDKERAMATIKNLRAVEKQAKKDAKQLKTLLEAEDKRKKSEMDETERLKAEASEWKEKHDAREESQKRDRMRYAVESEARKQKVLAEAVTDVYALIDQSAIEFNDAGDPESKDVEKAVKSILSTRKHMTQAHGGARTDNDADNGTGGASGGGYTDAEIEEIASNSGVSAKDIKAGLALQQKQGA